MAEQIIDGLVLGSVYALMALGVSLIFSLGGVVNMAHGVFYALGAYLAASIAPHTGLVGALVLSPIAVALLGVLIERFVLHRLYDKDPSLSLLFTFGLALTVEQILRLAGGVTGFTFTVSELLAEHLQTGDFIFAHHRLVILLLTSATVAGCWLLLNKTVFGMVLRASLGDAQIVRAHGISLKSISATIFALGLGFAALAGVISVPLAGLPSTMGTEILTATFVVVVIGGLGSFWGVVMAGLLVGVVHGLSVALFPPAMEVSMYLLMLTALLLRPDGLLGARFAKIA